MSEVFCKIRKSLFSCFFGLVASVGFLHAQDKKSIADIEKVYLHTDRSQYFVGEDLWYKAYNVRASNNLLFDKSNILYVELISSNSDIIIRNKTSLEMGLGHGDFQLQDSLDVKPGKYQLRAYTNWNRNFGNDFVFTKDIEIIDVFESKETAKTSEKAILETKKSNSKTIKQNPYKIDFFPEGGSFLENVASVVGFKAADVNGKPINIKGEIYNSDNELVSTFESIHDGMGKTQLLPIEGKSYYAKIKTESGFEFQKDLPKASQSGYALSYRNFKGRNIVTINSNQQTLAQNPNVTLTVVCKSRGNSYLETTQTLKETSLSFELPKDKIPDGISQITLFDNLNKPQSERLVYFEKDYDLEVQLSTDKTSYQPEEKVRLNVSSKSKSGEGKSASFSLSVTDTNGVEDENFDSNISSYFLMESDIRGKVHHPGYYFDTANPKRLEHLDNLLLTQGWRDFVWKSVPKIDEKNPYKAEKGITISGRVKQLFADKPLVNNNVTLALMSKKSKGIFSAVTDSIGRFQFENVLFSGKVDMYMNTRDENGKFRGELVLDSIESYPIPIRLKKEMYFLPEKNTPIIENVYKKYIAFGVKPENILNEVKIIKKNKFQTPVLYGVPDNIYKINKKQADMFSDVRDLISDLVRGVHFPIFPGDPFASVPAILVDGFPVSIDELYMVSPEDVVKIETASGPTVEILYGNWELVSVFTNGNTGKKNKKNANQTLKKELEGYYAARVFYSPDPENSNPDLDKKAAVRNTIYWNPYVHPDKTGNVSVNYFNSSVETKVKVALEGITASGIPVVKKAYYSIKKLKNF